MSLRNQVLSIFRKAVDMGSFNRVLQKVEIGDVSKGKLQAEFQVTPDCCNIMGFLHGGFSATLVDHLTTLALKSHFIAQGTTDKDIPSSVSIELSMSYLSGVKDGQRIIVEAEAVRVGRKVAFLTASIYNRDKEDELVATGKHTKFLI